MATQKMADANRPVEVTVPAGEPLEIVSEGVISANNSTTVLLGAGAVFTGTVEEVLSYSSITITLNSDVISATNGLKIQFSIDGTDWHETDSYTYISPSVNIMKTWAIQRVARYFRIIYTNGGTPQTHFELSVILNPIAGIASSHRIADNISEQDDAQLTKSVLSGKAPIGEQINIVANAQGALKTDVVTPVGSLPVSQLTTLHDGKILNREFTELNEVAGTGTGTFQDNKYNMSVASGEWLVHTAKRHAPYFAGKPQKVEITFDNFAPETNVTKRVGYFSSNTVSPFASDYDGFYLESGGGTIKFVLKRLGTTIFEIDYADWDGYDLLNGYQTLATWDNFTVVEFNFLWLGGAYIELRLVTQEGFTTIHKEIYAGSDTDVFLDSPNQPVRYEIRSTTGTGSFRYICNQIATAGSIDESGLSKSVNTGTTGITMTGAGTKRPLLGIRKKSGFRDNFVRLVLADILVDTNDRILWTVEINPTLSAGISYGALSGSAIEFGAATGLTTVDTPGIIIASGYISQRVPIPGDVFVDNYLAWLGGQLDGTSDELVLCVTPITSPVTVYGAVTIVEG